MSFIERILTTCIRYVDEDTFIDLSQISDSEDTFSSAPRPMPMLNFEGIIVKTEPGTVPFSPAPSAPLPSLLSFPSTSLALEQSQFFTESSGPGSQPLSTHPNVKNMAPGRFPLTYASDMIRGFDLAELAKISAKETAKQKHERVFPGKYSKTSYGRHKGAWENLCRDPGAKARFSDAGHTENGLWAEVIKIYSKEKAR